MKAFLCAITLLLTTTAFAEVTEEHTDRNVPAYNLSSTKIALYGFDPVSYFAEGGAVALEGTSAITTEYGGVIYHFATEINKNLFLENPTKYEPTYGGWCAWAMANNGYADIDPTLFTLTKIVDGVSLAAEVGDPEATRAHFFIARGPKARFDRQLSFHEANADTFWESESGEKPRPLAVDAIDTVVAE